MQAAALLRAHTSKAPHRLIQQPHLRLFWQQAFGAEAEVRRRRGAFGVCRVEG